MSDRPNILLLMTDQQRWDSLGCNGNRFVSTPNVDALAEGGANCANSFTPWPVCTPARATMWTGVYPHQHQVIYNAYKMDNVLKETSHEKRTVFEPLRESGYTTAYFGKWHLGEVDPGMFDVWSGFNSSGGHWVDDVQDGVYKPDQQTDDMIAFVKAQAGSDKPFFAVNGYYPPHDPYTAPKRFYEPYRDRGVPYAGYYAAVSAIDDNVGRLVAALDEAGLTEDTIIVYYSDHGDHFSYRGSDHKFTCHEDSIKIPMVISWPGTIKPGTVIDEFVGLQDLMPTILDWASQDIPDYLHGKSIVPLLEGESVSWRDSHYTENVIRGPFIEQRSVRTKEWKLILTRSVRFLQGYTALNELYDLVNDPEEELNIYKTPRGDTHNRFLNTPPQTDVIEGLVHELRKQASEIDDQLGVDMADFTLVEIGKRKAAGE
jgi:arylsulfatase A-like enzyme